MNNLRTYLLYFLILVYVSGSIGFVLNPGFFLPFTPYTLLLTTLAFLMYQPMGQRRFLVAFVASACLGFALEVAGVKTGVVFGHYYYGEALGIKLFGVPLTIALNWALLISAGAAIGHRISSNKWLVALLCASGILGIDLLMEQVAAAYDFWHFENGMAGLRNYVAWFVITFVLCVLFHKGFKMAEQKISGWVLLLQCMFFGTLVIIKYF